MKRSATLFLPVVAGLVAFAQLADTFHVALVPHELCAEHGEFVESSTSVRAPADALDGVETHFDQGLPAVDGASHEHCLATLATRQNALSTAPVAAIAPVSPTSFAPIAAALASRSNLEALRLAPKQSPPRA